MAHYEGVLGYLRRRAPADAAAEVAADAFLVAWRRLDEVPPGAAGPWLIGVARRTLANRRRGERRGLALVRRLGGMAEVVAPDPAERTGHDQAVREAFGRLSARDRETLALVAWEGLAPREAAAALGLPAQVVTARLFRARRRLRRALDETEGATGAVAASTPPPTAPEEAR